ncbi:hypothetical protein ACQPZJ_34175 [Actinoplanes sp. CA-054009]
MAILAEAGSQSWHDSKLTPVTPVAGQLLMAQMQLFTRAKTAELRDPTKARNYSPSAAEFRRDHEKRRAWGLKARHAQKLQRLFGSVAAAEAHFRQAAQQRKMITPPQPTPTSQTIPERPAAHPRTAVQFADDAPPDQIAPDEVAVDEAQPGQVAFGEAGSEVATPQEIALGLDAVGIEVTCDAGGEVAPGPGARGEVDLGRGAGGEAGPGRDAGGEAGPGRGSWARAGRGRGSCARAGKLGPGGARAGKLCPGGMRAGKLGPSGVRARRLGVREPRMGRARP